MFDDFSGVSNGKVQVANARVQLVYDLVSEQFLKFSIEPYSINDLKAAPELEIKEGNLSLRDRGYLTTNELKRHFETGSFFIYRHNYKTKYLDKGTFEPIDLLKLLTDKKNIDMEVRLNSNPNIIIRIVANTVSEKIANNRKRKAKKDLKKVTKPYLDMLNFTIFITNIPKKIADNTRLYDLYSLRWKIETIFKNWKSNLNFDKIHNVSKIQLSVMLHSRLLVAVLINYIHIITKQIIATKYNKELSIYKLTSYIAKSLGVINVILQLFNNNKLINSTQLYVLAYYCCYDKRKNKSNYEQELNRIFK